MQTPPSLSPIATITTTNLKNVSGTNNFSSKARFERTRERIRPPPRRIVYKHNSNNNNNNYDDDDNDDNDDENMDSIIDESDEQAAFLYEQGVPVEELTRFVGEKVEEKVLCPVCCNSYLEVSANGTNCPFCNLHLNTFNPFAVRDAVIRTLQQHASICCDNAKVWTNSSGVLIIACPKCGKIIPVEY